MTAAGAVERVIVILVGCLMIVFGLRLRRQAGDMSGPFAKRQWDPVLGFWTRRGGYAVLSAALLGLGTLAVVSMIIGLTLG